MRIVQQVLSGDVAGGQLVALRIAEAARDAGHDVLLVTPGDGPFVDRCKQHDMEVCVVPLGRTLRLDAAARYARVLRRERCDILHTHAHLAGNVLGRVAGRLAGARVIAHMHIENVFRTGTTRRAQVVLDNATARLCARIVAVSNATRESLLRQGYPRARVEVVHNGVELARARPHRLEGVPADAPLVLHVGRLAPVKGQEVLLRALPHVAGATAAFVGDDLEQGGAYRARLERLAAELGVADRTVFAGYREDVRALLAGADVLVLPSSIEGLPLVVLEAMAEARPVVATPVGGIPELVVEGETGLLVAPGDAGALADALRGLLADPARARRLGEAGRRRVEESFSAEIASRRVLELYDEVSR